MFQYWEDDMKRRTILKTALLGAATVAMMASASYAQEVTLRLHQFLPPPAPVPKLILKPWAARSKKHLTDASKSNISTRWLWVAVLLN